MQVTVKAHPETATRLAGGEVSPETDELRQAATDLGVTLEPMFPGSEDPEMASYFAVEVATREHAERVADRLRSLEAVDAAYVKPSDERP